MSLSPVTADKTSAAFLHAVMRTSSKGALYCFYAMSAVCVAGSAFELARPLLMQEPINILAGRGLFVMALAAAAAGYSIDKACDGIIASMKHTHIFMARHGL